MITKDETLPAKGNQDIIETQKKLPKDLLKSKIKIFK